MSLDAAALPDDVETLRRLVLEQRRQSEQLAEQLQQAHAGLIEKALEIEKLKAQLAKLRRMTFGHSSEKLDRQIEQERKSVVSGMSVAVRVDLGGRRILIKKNKNRKHTLH